jgi:hypothetical protein
MRKKKMREAKMSAAMKQTYVQPSPEACQIQSMLSENQHSAKGPSQISQDSLSLPLTATSQLTFVGTTSQPASNATSSFGKTSSSVFASETCPKMSYLTENAPDCICEGKGPFHEGYVAMATAQELCFYCRNTFSLWT